MRTQTIKTTITFEMEIEIEASVELGHGPSGSMADDAEDDVVEDLRILRVGIVGYDRKEQKHVTRWMAHEPERNGRPEHLYLDTLLAAVRSDAEEAIITQAEGDAP